MFLDSLDIANRALQHCEAAPITSVNEDSTANQAVTFAYDKVRRAELRRNIWRFATRKAVIRAVGPDTMILQPALWNASTTYYPGSIVSDINSVSWISIIKDNLNNPPGGNNEAWDTYFGPMTIEPYDTTMAYFAGELVYLPGSLPGTFVVYQSLQNANGNAPNDGGTAWDATVTYHSDMVVSYSGSQWVSLIEVNLNITPVAGPAQWSSVVTYSGGQQVTGSDNMQYSSLGGSNIGNDPTTTTGFWTALSIVTAWGLAPTAMQNSPTDIQWQVINAAMKNLTFQWPAGTGPTTQAETRNVYRLPAGYLSPAPQDPKAGSTNFLGAPSGEMYRDWLYEGDFIISRQVYPLLFRFVADIQKVRDMDDMFCEGLACRVATAIAPRITQSNAKLQTIASAYQLFMGEARRTNMIETGPVEPPEDDFITCRI